MKTCKVLQWVGAGLLMAVALLSGIITGLRIAELAGSEMVVGEEDAEGASGEGADGGLGEGTDVGAEMGAEGKTVYDELKLEVVPLEGWGELAANWEPFDYNSVTGKKLVALTFDDGPSAATTPRLLDILKEKKVKATFFVLGNSARNNAWIIQRAKAEGHEVGSHTMGHMNLAYASAATVRSDVAAMNQIFRDALGQNYTVMRPPYGNGIYRPEVKQNIAAPMIYWSVDTRDWESRNAVAVHDAVIRDTFDGAIVLLHDIHPTTVDAVGWIIDDLRARGYEFLTVPELAAARGVELKNGEVYFKF